MFAGIRILDVKPRLVFLVDARIISGVNFSNFVRKAEEDLLRLMCLDIAFPSSCYSNPQYSRVFRYVV